MTAPTAVPEAATGARMGAGVAVLALLVGLLTLPAGSLFTAATYATVTDGSLEVEQAGGWTTVASGADLVDGDRVRASGGEVTLTFDGGWLVLADGVRAAVAGRDLVVERGSVLVQGDTRRTVVVDGVDASGRGTWRVDAGSPARVASYDAEVEVRDGREVVSLAPYRQLTVRDRAVASASLTPLRYLASDPFDRAVLGEALRIDALATALGRSLASTYGTAPRESAFYTAFLAVDADIADHLPTLAPVATDAAYGPPADVLLAVTVADALGSRDGRPLDATIPEVAALRSRGATWGLIVVAAGGDADGFNAAADRALVAAEEDPPPPPPAPEVTVADDPAGATIPAAPPAPAGDGAPGGAPPDGEGTAPGADTTPGTAPAPAPGPPPAAPPPPPSPPSAPLAPVGEALDGVGRGLGQVVDGAVGLVDDVVGGVDELLGPPLRGVLGGG